ncbi:MAG: cell wall hydrolase [Lachnospiraceae bacterium]|nr:cell wall hydrolase [Lachnospiraceae bacterium]
MKEKNRIGKLLALMLGAVVFVSALAPMQVQAQTSTGTAKTSSSSFDESKIVMAKVKQYVNIREEATQDSAKLGVLYKDCGGTILEQKDGWTKIESGSVIGWVDNQYLYFGKEAAALAEEAMKPTATIMANRVNVREEPNTDSHIFGKLSKGEKYEVIEDEVDDADEEGKWISIYYGEEVAYVSEEYVEITNTLGTAESIEEIKAREEAEAAAAAAALEAKKAAERQLIMENANEFIVLAALIQCEAGGEPYEGQVAVGAVVMNRVKSTAYPNTIKEVIYQKKQFSPATSSKMNNLILTGSIKQSCQQAALEAMSGVTNVGDALNFRRVGTKTGIVIGNHVFW